MAIHHSSTIGLDVCISKDPNYPLVKQFIYTASCEENFKPKLQDNPYTFDQMTKLDKTLSIVWHKQNIPCYGYFFTQYPELPSNVLRVFVRAYKTSYYPGNLTRKFYKEEKRILDQMPWDLLLDTKIDTIFWTRHSSQVEREFKWEKYCNQFNYDVYTADNILFKGIKQNIHYCSMFGSDKEPDITGLKSIGEI